ncbi:hypothetical protein [Sphaerisporangium corydalis]|uniref:Cupin n=1 Tax=Sphaerisporangium corydalis TaxID=1441875 RepID=A0ABV9EB17_9ACTN|nr:hypothetical protein [Sphaerisporangium corydalis]
MRYRELYAALASGAVPDALPGWTLGLLRDIAGGRSAIRGVRHPLGFVCLPVARGEYGVCVHVWSGGLLRAGTTTSEVHCHGWDLASYVLYGRMLNELARVTDGAGDATHRVFAVVSSDGVDDITPTGRTVRYTGGTPEAYHAGQAYTLPAGVFHRSVIPEGVETATVAVAVMRAGAADLSLGPLGARPHRVTRERCDDEGTARAARLAAEHLART